MTKTTTGWLIFVAAFGTMVGLVGADLLALKSLNEVVTPQFIGSTLIHFSVVVAAFMGGKIIPSTGDGITSSTTTTPISINIPSNPTPTNPPEAK